MILLRRTALSTLYHHLREAMSASMVVQSDHCPSARNTRLWRAGLTAGRQLIQPCRPASGALTRFLPCSQGGQRHEQGPVTLRSEATHLGSLRSRWSRKRVPGYRSSHSEPHHFEDSDSGPFFHPPSVVSSTHFLSNSCFSESKGGLSSSSVLAHRMVRTAVKS
jgi:hypothetical protein